MPRVELFEAEVTDGITANSNVAVVRIDALRKFREVVAELGGDADVLLSKSLIDPAVLDRPNTMIPYRLMVHLLERAASELKCADFGMRLAAAQNGAKVLGPMETVINNCKTVGDAFRYTEAHIHAYSPATRTTFERDAETGRNFLRYEILLHRLPYQRQAVEQALALVQHSIGELSDGQARASEIWFMHEPLAPRSSYRRHLGATVRFGMPANGAFISDRDLNCPVASCDPQLFEPASRYVESRFPPVAITVSAQARAIIARLLVVGQCTNERVAAALGLHTRTLQRRLHEEGENFHRLKDAVRRDTALRYLRQSDMPLTRVAEMLDYSETSVLSRSCVRWFAASPRKVRSQLTQLL